MLVKKGYHVKIVPVNINRPMRMREAPVVSHNLTGDTIESREEQSSARDNGMGELKRAGAGSDAAGRNKMPKGARSFDTGRASGILAATASQASPDCPIG